jgi:two-component system response regulator AtoC
MLLGTNMMTQCDTIRTATLTPVPLPPQVWALAVLGEGVNALRRLPVAGAVLLGRDGGATLTIGHRSLSRRHALLRIDGVVTIQDLGSRNGTVLGGRRLHPGETRVVRPGDVLQLGSVSITLVRA